jgi:hypothetical protein
MADADDAPKIEHDRTWTLSEILALKIPSAEITLREYLVALTVEEAMDVHLADQAEHISALDVDCDAVLQHMFNAGGEVCIRVGVTVIPLDPGWSGPASGA